MCYAPFYIKDKFTCQQIPVPCGKCPHCRERRTNGWAFRITQQLNSKQTTSAHFITLTYATDNIPITKGLKTTLKKRDLQLFFKRLRKQYNSKHDSRRIKYYATGEYGGRTIRPHYHIIVFNASIESISNAWRTTNGPIGHVHFGTVTPASIRYSIDYMSKPKIIPQFKGDDRQPEFSLFSKGLGEEYINKQTIKWHKEDLKNRMYVNIPDGKKVAMPRYYKQKIYKKYELKMINEQLLANMETETIRLQNKYPQSMWNESEAKRKAFNKMNSKSKKHTV